MSDINNMTLNELESRITALESKGKSLGVDKKFELKKLQRRKRMLTEKEDAGKGASGVFVPDDVKEERQIEYILIDKIVMPEYNDRSGIDQKKLEDLSKSIEKIGLLNPILVRENADGTYTKENGRRRIDATRMLGKKKIKAFVARGDISQEILNLIVFDENTQREGLSIYDKVRGLINIIATKRKCSKEEVVRMVTRVNNYEKGLLPNITEKEMEEIVLYKESILESFEESHHVFTSISNFIKHLKVLKMSPEIVKLLSEDKITFNMASTLDKNKDKEYDMVTFSELVQTIIRKKLSVNEAKKLLNKHLKSKIKEKDISEIVEDKISKMKKNVSKLATEEVEALNKEIEHIMDKYFKK